LKGFGDKFRAWDRDFGWIYRTALLVVFLVGLVSAPFWIFSRRSAQTGSFAMKTRAAQNLASTEDSGVSMTGDSQAITGIEQRELYPYSIIPGGAYSRAELVRAIASDPVVARHYSDFDVSKTHVVRLDHSEVMYVSYRIGSDVYWTRKPLTLRAGETLLTDGKRTARTRCGNRLSSMPSTPISQHQPLPAAIETPPNLPLYAVLPGAELPILPPSSPFLPTVPTVPTVPIVPTQPITPINGSPVGVLPSPLPLPYFPVIGGGGPSGPGSPGGPGGPGSGPVGPPTSPPPMVTPEPGTLPLASLGIGLLGIIAWRKRRNRRTANPRCSN
jgi:hypothetical protein